MKKFVIILILCIFFVGCQDLENLKNINFVSKNKITTPPVLEDVNDTINNSVINETENEINIDYDGSLYYFVSNEGIVIAKGNKAIVIDSNGYKAVELLNKYNLDLEYYIVTNDLYNSHATNIILSKKPSIVFDKGLDTELRRDYLKYADKMDITSVPIIKDRTVMTDIIDIEFIVPFADGFFEDKEMNSLVIKAGNLLYMSGCKGECENRVNEQAKVIVLSNNGKCPTNGIDFILKSDPKIIMGETKCQDISDLDYFSFDYKEIESYVAIKEDYLK